MVTVKVYHLEILICCFLSFELFITFSLFGIGSSCRNNMDCFRSRSRKNKQLMDKLTEVASEIEKDHVTGTQD